MFIALLILGLVLLIVGIMSGNWLLIVAGVVLLALAVSLRTPRPRA